MISSQHEALARELIASFPERCRARGLKVTHQRLAVYEALAADREHPSAERIHARLARRFPVLSLATVHRILEAFEERGLVTKANPIHAAARFDANDRPHHHVACRVCQRIEDVRAPELDALRPPRGAGTRFSQLRGEVVFVGVCDDCARPARPRRR